MRLYDPTVSGPERHLARAPALASIDEAKIGILANGKLNASEMLGEVADLLVRRHGCTIAARYHKSNASAPAPAETLAKAAKEVDFLITGLGD